MNEPLVVVTDTVFPSLEPVQRVLAAVNARLEMAPQPLPEVIATAARRADALLVTYAKVPGDTIRRLECCKIISRTGIGVDNVDVEAATEKGIVVTRVPDYCIDEVSDHSLALLLALARKIPLANRLVSAGTWSVDSVGTIHRLRGQTLGLVGFGQIPRALAPKAQALGVQVVAYDPYVAAEAMAREGVRQVTFDELLEEADLISIHAPLTPETHHLFGREAFEKMRPGALLVNTARGPLVDTAALVEALDAGKLAGAALDVLEVEPPPPNSKLLGRSDLLLTPHTAFYSVESLLDLQVKAAEEVLRVLQGQRPRNPVNPQVLEPQAPGQAV
ncbi:MAG TPA: C-terminal binding protein [Anaerolineae bacterium]|nr:C-terminal binding protein [Anaerolineae bacterium]